MNVSINLTAHSNESDSSARLFSKALQGIARLEIGIESKEDLATINIKPDENGKPSIELDAINIDMFAEKISLSVAQYILISSALAIESGQVEIEGDKSVNIATQKLMNLAANIMNISANSLTLRSKTVMNLLSPSFNLTAGNINLESPLIKMLGQITLGTGDLRPIARTGDQVEVHGVESGSSVATGTIITGGSNFSS